MQYITHNNENINTNETHGLGSVTASYGLLCSLFGQPYSGDGYKTDAQWDIEFSNGAIASIYNWKNGMNYCGVEGIPTNCITRWNVAGYEHPTLTLIKDVIEHRERMLVLQNHNPYWGKKELTND